jgi:hypothetical protein
MDVDCLDEVAHADHMAKGLCFDCHKHGHQANCCPNKKKKIPVRQENIEEEEEEEEEEEDEEVENHCLTEDF